MKKSAQRKASPKSTAAAPKATVIRQAFRLAVESQRLPAVSSVPDPCVGWVVCASSEGAGKWEAPGIDPSSGMSPSTLFERFHGAGFATLELDLVDRSEKDDQLIRFDIPLLARRLISAMEWIRQTRQSHSNRVAILASGNAAGAALWCSVQKHVRVAALVSLQGRPHLAEPLVGDVTSPTLLLVAGDDPRLLQVNQQAEHRLNCASRLVSVSASSPRERKVVWKRLTLDALGWIESQTDRRPSTSLSFLDFVRLDWAPRLKRQFLAALTFLSFSLAAPQTARTEARSPGEAATAANAGTEGKTRSTRPARVPTSRVELRTSDARPTR